MLYPINSTGLPKSAKSKIGSEYELKPFMSKWSMLCYPHSYYTLILCQQLSNLFSFLLGILRRQNWLPTLNETKLRTLCIMSFERPIWVIFPIGWTFSYPRKHTKEISLLSQRSLLHINDIKWGANWSIKKPSNNLIVLEVISISKVRSQYELKHFVHDWMMSVMLSTFIWHYYWRSTFV